MGDIEIKLGKICNLTADFFKEDSKKAFYLWNNLGRK
mgnify:CR=1 FL=1